MKHKNLKNITLILTAILLGILSNTPAAAQERISIAASERGNPFINFTDGKPLAGDAGNLSASGATNPSAAASADFDADGVADLAIAYETGNGGLISIQRGNIESIFPPSADAQPSPFLPNSLTPLLDLPFAPDFLAAGDFNADGKQDLLAAKIGVSNLIIRAGIGNGDFAAPQVIELGGKLTAFAVGEMNGFDNLADVAVGIMEKNGARVLIFQNRGGAFAAEANVVQISKAANALALGEVDAHPSHDLAIAAGDEIVLISGRVGEETGEVKADRITRRKMSFQIADLAIGDFVGERENEIAVLSANGELFLSESPAVAGGLKFGKKASLSTGNPPATASGSDLLLTAKVSTRTKADLIITGNQNLNLITNDGADNLTLAATFDGNENLVAVLPMRLNKDALNDLVVLTETSAAPSILLTAPTGIITVDNSGGGSGGSGTTLFNAIQTANNTPGLQEIQFNLSGNTQISMTVALPIITDAITLNGFSQSNPNGEPLVSINTQPLTDASTLQIQGGNSVVRGLVLNCADAEGNPVRLFSANNFIEGNFIGTNTNGLSAGVTANSAILVSASGNNIGGATTQARNIISGTSGENSHGVHINFGGNNRIRGNYIGTDKAGLAAVSNGGSGVLIETGASGNIVGGETDGERNVISANGFNMIFSPNPGSGVKIKLPANAFSDALVENNFIGTNKNGDAALGNAGGGVRLEYAASGNPTATANFYDNVISGNTGDGVYAVNTAAPLLNAAPDGGVGEILILGRRRSAFNAIPEAATPGNRIGVSADGTAALPNTGNGLSLQNAPAKIEGNIISANGANGIKSVSQPSATRFSQIADNYIGTDATGTADLGNTGDGVNLEFDGTAASRTIEPSKIWNNVISGNGGDGLEINGQNVVLGGNLAAPEAGAFFFVDIAARRTNLNANSPEIAPTGNRIGTNAAGTAALGNAGNGVSITAAPTKIGSETPTEGNIIAYNGANGVVILSGTRNLIRSNSIFSNTLLDVDLGGDGVTLNDPLDADEGANGLQNYPTLTTATSAGANIQINGAFHSKPNNPYLLVFYATANCTGTKSLAEQNQVGTTMITTDANGNAPVNSSFAASIPAGQFITSNAIDFNSVSTAEDNTSEFSPCVAVRSPTPTPTPTPTGTVSGRVIYANAPTTTGVPFTTITAVGSIPLSTTTDANGFYSISGFGAGAYTITPSKTNQVNGISNLDASRIAQHIVGLTVLDANQRIAADTSGNGAVSSLDASYIAQFVAAIANPSITGTWKFLPSSRSYPNVLSNQTNQDYSAILVGDVTGNWNPLGSLYPEFSELKNGLTTQPDKSGQMVGVTAERNQSATEKAALTVNLTATDTTGKDILGYQFDLLYDAAVIEPQAISCDVSDTISRELTAICHASESGVLKVVVFGATPISGTGTLLKLKFNVNGATGSTSPLRIENFMFNEDTPQAVAIDGQVLTADSTKQ